MERLGAKVMYASSYRFVVSTERAESPAAEAFIGSLLEAISHNPLFSALHIKRTKTWNSMLWLDSSNFTGIVAEEADEESEVGKEEKVCSCAWLLIEEFRTECERHGD